MPVVRMRSVALLLPFLLVLAASSSCAGLGQVFEKPRVRVLGADVTNVSLTSADLIFDFSVENPNGLSLVLDAVGYRLRVNGEPFLDGSSDRRTEIAARGASRVQLPVTLRYADILRVVRLLEGERSAGYELDADFRFDVPVIGGLTVPVRKRGDIPLDRIQIR